MRDTVAALKPALYALADAVGFLFGTPLGLGLAAAAIVAVAALKLGSAMSARRLAAKAAGEDFGKARALGLALGELGSMVLRAVVALPTLVAVAAVSVGVVALADSSRKLDEYLAGRQRIAELQATVRNLERRYRAVDVAIIDASGGLIEAELSYYDYRSPNAPAKSQRLRLRGRELFVDAIVCNFDYSEISAGRQVNLAIPFRAFTDELPQSEGVELGLLDGQGVPLMFRRPPEGVYGIGAAAYDERLAELSGILRSEEAARGEGIVRSLYGNAVHRAARAGDRFTIWVEQTGGLTIKEDRGF
jgi:hypothetical protein